MRSSLVVLLSISVCYSVYAQADSASMNPSWFLSVHSGALVGKSGNGTTASVALIPGIRLHRVSIGVGAGYDTYLDWQTLPVFTGVSYDFVRREHHSFFVQLNGGYSVAWARHRAEGQFDWESEGGFFYHPMVGYRVHQGKFTLYFSAGYKLQRLTYEHFPGWWTIMGTPAMKRTVVRDMERFTLNIGFGLW